MQFIPAAGPPAPFSPEAATAIQRVQGVASQVPINVNPSDVIQSQVVHNVRRSGFGGGSIKNTQRAALSNLVIAIQHRILNIQAAQAFEQQAIQAIVNLDAAFQAARRDAVQTSAEVETANARLDEMRQLITNLQTSIANQQTQHDQLQAEMLSLQAQLNTFTSFAETVFNLARAVLREPGHGLPLDDNFAPGGPAPAVPNTPIRAPVPPDGEAIVTPVRAPARPPASPEDQNLEGIDRGMNRLAVDQLNEQKGD